MRISVYIPSYNQRDYLREAIESVLGQTLRPHELIIVDDCSTDGSRDVIEEYRSRYPTLVRTILLPQNSGIAPVRRQAMEAITGDYVTWVDGDDRLLPGKLETEARMLSGGDAELAYSNFAYIDAAGHRTGTWANGEDLPQGDVFLRTFAREFPRRNLFRNELVNYRAWKEVGFHDPALRLYEDYDMRIRLTQSLRVAGSAEVLSEYRVHGQGLSNVPAAKSLATLQAIYRKNLPLLAGYSASERAYARRGFAKWTSVIAKAAFEQALNNRSRWEAFTHLWTAFTLDPKADHLKLLRSFLRS